jgi:hypothetical protein
MQSDVVRSEHMSTKWYDADVVKVTNKKIDVNGTPRTRFCYLVQFGELHLGQGTLLVARGQLERGAMAVGLLRDEKWHRQVVIDGKGAFVSAVEVGEEGNYVPMITNATANDGERTRFSIIEIGILEPRTAK